MSTKKWRPEEEHLLRILMPFNSYAEIAEQISKRHEAGVPGFVSERSSESVRKKVTRDGITAESCESYNYQNKYTDRWDEIREVQEAYRERGIDRTAGVFPTSNNARKILSLSDIHFPLARVDLLEQAVQDHADADVVVINGDLLEGYMWSTFAKSKRIAAVDEYRAAFTFIEMLSQKFPDVVLVSGNHDARVSRHLKSNGFEKETSQLLRPDMMARIANGEKLDASGMLTEKLAFDNVHYDAAEAWYVRIGKTLFCHPHNRGSSKPGWTAQTLMGYFDNRYPPGEYDSIVCGHTHKIYKGVVNNKLLMEQGCMAGLMMYAHSPKMQYTASNGMNGYAVVYQDAEGNVNMNDSHVVYLGDVMPPKKELILGS